MELNKWRMCHYWSASRLSKLKNTLLIMARKQFTWEWNVMDVGCALLLALDINVPNAQTLTYVNPAK